MEVWSRFRFWTRKLPLYPPLHMDILWTCCDTGKRFSLRIYGQSCFKSSSVVLMEPWIVLSYTDGIIIYFEHEPLICNLYNVNQTCIMSNHGTVYVLYVLLSCNADQNRFWHIVCTLKIYNLLSIYRDLGFSRISSDLVKENFNDGMYDKYK